MRYEFGICGAFDFEEKYTGGQSVKTREFYFALCTSVGRENIHILESTLYKKNPLSFLFKFIYMLMNCRHTIIFPAQNGIKVFAPICSLLKINTNIHYCVIGGWLPEKLRKDKKLLKYVKTFKSVLVETSVMKKQLEELGLNNVYKLVNFKQLQPINTINNISSPVKLCFFSRVVKEKGIEDAIQVVKKVNEQKIRCIFDIYGPIVEEYKNQFEIVKKAFTEEIRYMGKINPTESISVLKNYDIQLFPTQYETEGIPGSIIDSYFAGLPVIASKWNSYSDVIIDGVTGVGFSLGNISEFELCLRSLLDDPQRIIDMKYNCLVKAEEYLPKTAIELFLEIINK